MALQFHNLALQFCNLAWQSGNLAWQFRNSSWQFGNLAGQWPVAIRRVIRVIIKYFLPALPRLGRDILQRIRVKRAIWWLNLKLGFCWYHIFDSSNIFLLTTDIIYLSDSSSIFLWISYIYLTPQIFLCQYHISIWLLKCIFANIKYLSDSRDIYLQR